MLCNLLFPGDEPVPPGSEPGELGELRGRLLFLLETSKHYQAQHLLTHFPESKSTVSAVKFLLSTMNHCSVNLVLRVSLSVNDNGDPGNEVDALSLSSLVLCESLGSSLFVSLRMISITFTVMI